MARTSNTITAKKLIERVKKKTIWTPNPGRQTEVLTRTEFEILYGGRRGGGKTDAGIAWLLYDKDKPLYRALVIRKNADDLNDWVDRANRMYTPLGAKPTGKPAEFLFPSGAIIRTGHLKDAQAYTKYQGHEYQKMLIEELTQIPAERNYEMLISSCRSTQEDIQPQIFSTCNPDGAGFYWVKKRWALQGIPHNAIVTEVIDAETKKHLDRVFVPAGLADNPYLDRDGNYKAFLNSLPDGLKQAWRDGSWDEPIIAGAYYTRELLQMSKEKRIKFVAHDPRLRVHTVWDLGIDDSMSIGFWQKTSKDLTLIDYYENEGFGLQHYWEILEEKRTTEHYIYGRFYLPHDARHRMLNAEGSTVEKEFQKLGMKSTEVIPKTNSISNDIQLVRMLFPKLYINEQKCVQFTNSIRNYRKKWDEKLLRYNEEPVHDWTSHASDMLRATAKIYEKMTNNTLDGQDYDEENYERRANVDTRRSLFRRR